MFDVDWDGILNCWTLHYAGEIICLGASSEHEAKSEAQLIVDTWEG